MGKLSKSLESVLEKLITKTDDGTFVLDNSKLKTDKKFVLINNKQNSCSECDLFYINTMNISELNKFQDIDGLYKINIVFTDENILEIVYYEYTKMVTDYNLILKYFENNFYEKIDFEEDEDSDSDSDSDSEWDSEYDDYIEKNGTLYFALVGYESDNVSPSFPYTNAVYDLCVWDHELQFDQGDIPVVEGTQEVTYFGSLDGKEFYANIFSKYYEDQSNHNYDYYGFDDDITFYETLEEAQVEYRVGYTRTTVLVTTNRRGVRVEF